MEPSSQSLEITRLQPDESNLPPVYVTYLAWEKTWLLLADYQLVYEDTVGNRTIEFLIPIHFRFDLASIPRILWPLISSFELSIAAPLIHDYLYRFQGRPIHHAATLESVEFVSQKITRKRADQIFYDIMILEGVPKWKAVATFKAVRWFAPKW
jgi:hypothetical protein